MHGFAKTLTRMDSVDERTTRFLGMIEAASGQMSELLDDLGLVARVEAAKSLTHYSIHQIALLAFDQLNIYVKQINSFCPKLYRLTI